MAYRFKEGAEGTKGIISAVISAVHQAAGFPPLYRIRWLSG
jgi:hypothetical protein